MLYCIVLYCIVKANCKIQLKDLRWCIGVLGIAQTNQNEQRLHITKMLLGRRRETRKDIIKKEQIGRIAKVTSINSVLTHNCYRHVMRKE